MYKDAKSREHEQTIAAMCAQYKPAAIIDGPVALCVICNMPRPASMCKRSKRTGEPLQDPAAYPHTGKPDADNLLKSVLDGMTKAGWWRDDAQVHTATVIKRVSALDESPCMVVQVMWHGEQADAEIDRAPF